MSPTFRPRKSESGSRRRGTGRTNKPKEGLPQTDVADLENLPELDYNHYEQLSDAELMKVVKKLKMTPEADRSVIVEEILIRTTSEETMEYARGILDLGSDNWGFLRRENYVPSNNDVYVSQAQVKKFGLRSGDTVFGLVRQPKEGEKYRGLLRVESVNGFGTAHTMSQNRRNFDSLTPLFPEERICMEINPENIPARVIDLIAPIGKGSRGLIVAPPKAGKTTIIKTIAAAISANHPEISLLVLLVDERPEEVTDMRRSVKGQVISSTFDEPADNHMRVTELCLEQAKRLVESGKDVVILLDSITRLSRASNLTINPSGRTLSGGLDPAALYRPRRFFGAARNIEEGGSLTIIATALVDTGSKMDDAIFEEFKGTGNMEIVLDRELAERRIWPAIDVRRSSTRHEEKLFAPNQLEGVIQLHRLLANQQNTVEATDQLIKLLKKTPTNQVFLDQIMQRMKATV
ncbi:MAG: transcription termination factor Rho [Chthonomonas sp.]|nr:transcription termination factor Rho [Chthonomonas sp.]